MIKSEKNRATSNVDELIAARHAIRRFTSRPVSEDTVRTLLNVARHAPSALNTQPWKAHALTGTALDALACAACAAHDAGDLRPEYPNGWFGEYEDRRRDFGSRFYGLLGIQRHERDRLSEQQKNNYRFYGAPVGFIFTIDRRLERGSWTDCGMFLQTLMIAARTRGLDTCPQGCWCNFPHIIRDQLGLSENETVVCGMALGYADTEAIERQLIVDRLEIDEFTRFHGFEQNAPLTRP